MDLPIIDLDVFLSKDPSAEAARAEECTKAAQALITYGALVLHDSRVSEDDNTTFLDLLEDYFAQPATALREDERPELGFQVGVTLENTEKPKCAVDEPCLDVIARLDPAERPLDISAHSPDPKCRFFWSMPDYDGDAAKPFETKFPSLNAENVVPRDPAIRERWTPVMTTWGSAMKSAYVFCALIAPPFSLPSLALQSINLIWCVKILTSIQMQASRDSRRWPPSVWVCPPRPLLTQESTGKWPTRTLHCRYRQGVRWKLNGVLILEPRPHLLAPTASDLVKYGEKDTILAGFHTDLNFLTIHGRSRYPGLRYVHAHLALFLMNSS